MATKRILGKDGIWRDVNDARLPESLGSSNQVLQMDALGNEVVWGAPKFTTDQPLTDQLILDPNLSFKPLDDAYTEGIKVYAITDFGKKVLIGRLVDTVMERVGGTIYYIDNTNTDSSAYIFYDEVGNEISSVKVGDRPFAYRRVRGVEKPRYYVVYDTPSNKYRWTFMMDGKPAYHATELSDDDGLANTNNILENGRFYVSDKETIWYYISSIRDMGLCGCTDWFIPARNESKILYEATYSDNTLIIDPNKYKINTVIATSTTQVPVENDQVAYGMFWDKVIKKFVDALYNKADLGIVFPVRKF